MNEKEKRVIRFGGSLLGSCLLSVIFGTALHVASAGTDPKPVRIEILYTENTNGVLENCDCPGSPLGGLDKRLTIMQRLANRDSVPALFLDAGDILSAGGFPEKDRYVLEAYAIINYDAIGLGDQEFINGKRFLSDIERHLRLPLVSSNLVVSGNDGVVASRRLIKKAGGIRFGILSVIGNEPFELMEKEKTAGLAVTDFRKALRDGLDALHDSADIVILLSHLGHDQDVALAREFPQINIIIGAHSQTLQSTPEKYGNTLVVQAGNDSRFVGQLTLECDPRGKNIVRSNGMVHPVLKQTPGDPRMADLLASFHRSITANFKDTLNSPSTGAGKDRVVVANSVCRGCHLKEWKSWQLSSHAFASLVLDSAPANRGKDCIVCHATWFGGTTGFTSAAQTPEFANVGCVECHQVSAGHLDGGKGVVGRITPQTCIRCHSQEVGPTFMFSSAIQHIRHGAQSGGVYVVREGDCLIRIAREHYSEPTLWKVLYDANKETVNDPDRIYPGQKLVMPETNKK